MKLFQKFLNLIFPLKCIFCEEITRGNNQICENCENILNAKPITQIIFEKNGFISYCLSPFKYEDKIKNAIWSFKFRNQKIFAKVFAEIICGNIFKKFPNEKFDLVTFVPNSKKKIVERGYNQAEVLAKEISLKLQIPCEDILFKIKDNVSQHTLPKSLRKENVSGVYSVGNDTNVLNKNILLCDDVITTGNTLKECVKILHKNDANSVLCVTLACSI